MPSDAKQFDSDNAIAECRGALRAAIRGVEVNEAELDVFSQEFAHTFSKVLTPEKGGMSWTDARAHVTFLAGVLVPWRSSTPSARRPGGSRSAGSTW